MKCAPLFVLFYVLTPAFAGKTTSPATWTDKIRKDLLMNSSYDKYSRPHEPNNSTTVSLGISFTHLNIDELKSMLIVDGWIKLRWTDAKLKWNPADYGGVSMIHVAYDEIWRPDVVLYNTAEGNDIDNYGKTLGLVYSTGEILWVPPATLKIYCDLDLRKYPRDVQTCTLKLGSWTYHVQEIDLQIWHQQENEVYLLTNTSEWQLIKVEKERHEIIYPCCSDAYPDITFTITLKRRSPSFISLIVVPATAVMLLTLASFWMPPQSGERVVFNVLSALIICDLQRAISNKLPDASGATPYILMFYSASLALVTIALIIAVFSLNISRSPRHHPPPAALRIAPSGFLGRLLCVSSVQTTRGKDTSSGDITNYSQDWLSLARAINHLAFYACLIVFIVLTIAFL